MLGALKQAECASGLPMSPQTLFLLFTPFHTRTIYEAITSEHAVSTVPREYLHPAPPGACQTTYAAPRGQTALAAHSWMEKHT